MMKITKLIQNKTVKISLVSIAAGLASLLLALIGLAWIFNPNDYKPLIIKKVTKATGRQLKLSGNIQIDFFPKILLHVNKVSLGNPSDFKPGTFAEAKTIHLQVSLLPLLIGTIKVESLIVDGLRLNLMKSNSENNWSFPTTTDKQTTGSSLLNLKLQSANLNNTQISYTDLSTATHLTTKSFNFSIMTEQNGFIQIAKKKVELQNAKFNLANHLRGEVNWVMDKSAKLAYYGNLTLTDFSLVKICDILNVAWPKRLFNKPFQHLTLFTGIQGDKENISLSNLHLKVGDSQLQGSLVVSATDYFKLRENLSLDQADIADFIDLDGFKLKVESATVIGDITGDARINLTRLNGKEQIYMKKLTLYGLDLNKFSAEVNKAINSMSSLKKLTATREAEAALKYIRQTIEKISNLRQKNYAEKTNLGQFKANLLIKAGFVTTPRFELAGPNLNTTGKGKINLNQQTLNYLLTSQIISPTPPTVINYLYFPFTCKGSFSQMDTGFEWSAILSQLVNYYAAKNKDKSVLKKAYNAAKDVLQEVFD